ncbi:MAG: hypothetical protein ACLFWB_05775 [Armatimonadota bacterium]
MTIVWSEWYQLIAVAIGAGAVISVMVYIRGRACSASASELRNMLLSFWAALLASIGSMIVVSTYAGGPMLEVSTEPFGVEAAKFEGPTAAAAILSVLITIGLWAVTIRQLNQTTVPPLIQQNQQQKEADDDSD